MIDPQVAARLDRIIALLERLTEPKRSARAFDYPKGGGTFASEPVPLPQNFFAPSQPTNCT